MVAGNNTVEIDDTTITYRGKTLERWLAYLFVIAVLLQYLGFVAFYILFIMLER